MPSAAAGGIANPIAARNAQRAAAAAEKRQANDLRRQDLQLTANLTRPSEYMDGGNGPAITEESSRCGGYREIVSD